VSDIVLAFDYGLARIGIASANRLTRTATPLVTLRAAAGRPSWIEIDRIVAEWHPAALVVGLPGANEHPLHPHIASFVQELRVRYKLPLHTVDESLTSAAAASELGEQRREGRRRSRKGDIDMRAACLIAEQWMNQGNA
jgi:putative pre-16S rRNA nuclease